MENKLDACMRSKTVFSKHACMDAAMSYHSRGQKTIAENVIKEINDTKIWNAPIVTQIEPLESFIGLKIIRVNISGIVLNNPAVSHCTENCQVEGTLSQEVQIAIPRAEVFIMFLNIDK